MLAIGEAICLDLLNNSLSLYTSACSNIFFVALLSRPTFIVVQLLSTTPPANLRSSMFIFLFCSLCCCIDNTE